MIREFGSGICEENQNQKYLLLHSIYNEVQQFSN